MSSPRTTTVPILVVDDEEIITAALGEILRQAGHPVVTFCDPMLALEELKTRPFSVVISDQRMPGLSGLELLAQARQLQPNATRILITGVLDLNTVVEAINQGEIYRFIVKPWLREEFLATVANALQRYELLCQNAQLQASAQAVNEQLKQANSALEDKIQVVALQNQRLADMNKALEKHAARACVLYVRVLEVFDGRLAAQARCVAQVCKAIATVLKLPDSETGVLESAAHLHDLGLMGLSRSLIRRWQADPHQLEPAELELIRQHPISGQQLAATVFDLPEVGEVIRSHHEQFNGQGYPDGVRGEKIPLLARLLAPTVAYVSSSLPLEQALAALKIGAGSLFDPEAVQILMRALPLASFPSPRRQLLLKELEPGMILADGIYSHNGILLVPAGQRLTETYIKELRGYDRSHPLKQALLVYC